MPRPLVLPVSDATIPSSHEHTKNNVSLPTSLRSQTTSHVFSHCCIICRRLHRTGVPPFQQLAASLSLLPFFFRLPSFVFNRLQPLFRKHPGGGYQDVRAETSVTRSAPVLTILALSALSLMTAPAAEAWGCRGHEAVA